MYPEAAAFRQACDLLLELRNDHGAAVQRFRWPRLTAFDWALDHLDAMAAGADHSALWTADA